MKKPLKVFIIDKDENSSAIISGYLKETECEMSIETAESLSDAKNSIDNISINLFIIDIDGNEEKYLLEIEDIERKNRNCKFIITSYKLKTDYIVKFLRSSKKDFIEKPIARTSFIAIVKEIAEKMTSEQDFSGHGKVISVFSNKGGLGKTTISVNLAWQLGYNNPADKIVLVDMNSFLGDITTFLDINPPYDINFLIEKIKAGEKISDITTIYGKTNLHVIADSANCYKNNLSKEDIILLFNHLRKHFKYIIVDSSSAITEKTEKIFDISDIIVLITEANLPALNNCKRCLDFFENQNILDKTELVLNRYSYDDDCSLQDVENVLRKEVLTGIPNNWRTTIESINKGLTIGESSPNTDISDSYAELAQLITKKLCH